MSTTCLTTRSLARHPNVTTKPNLVALPSVQIPSVVADIDLKIEGRIFMHVKWEQFKPSNEIFGISTAVAIPSLTALACLDKVWHSVVFPF
jgi:hypothetical protein